MHSWPTVIFTALFIFLSTPTQSHAGEWSGFYGGIQIGAFWSKESSASINQISGNNSFFFGARVPTSLAPEPSGVIGGVQAGFNLSAKNLIVGLEADFSVGNSERSASEIRRVFPANFTTTIKSDVKWLSTFRARVGFLTSDRLLFFGTGGVAIAKIQNEFNYTSDATITFLGGPGVLRCEENVPCFSATRGKTQIGWTFGGGFEYALSNSIKLKTEYLFIDLGNQQLSEMKSDPVLVGVVGLSTSVDNEFHLARTGLSINF